VLLRQRQVRIVPGAEHAEADELVALDADPLHRVLVARGADLDGRHARDLVAERALHRELDRQAVAVPARLVLDVVAGHRAVLADDVLEDLVEDVAVVDVAVGVGRPVVEHVGLGVAARLEDARVELAFGPLRQHRGLAPGEVRLHRKLRFGKVQRRFVVHDRMRELSTRQSVGYARRVASVRELLDEAIAVLDLADRDERAAKLFVIAAKLQATGDDVATAEARALLVKAADDGSALAAFDLGMLLVSGRGGEIDTAAGLLWLGRAATVLPAAATVLGGMLLFDGESAGDGITWLRRGAAAGEPSAFWLLGAAHLRGLGVAVDAGQARLLMAAAADAGVVEAQLELATMFADGVGGVRDETSAARW